MEPGLTGGTAIVLAMHGLPPRDFPQGELADLFGLHAALRASAPPTDELAQRYAALDARIRAWPRTGANDPFYVGSHELATRLGQETGRPVFVGFNEFCAPTLDAALDSAARAANSVMVITPMMTAGGDHSEIDIPSAIHAARQRHRKVTFIYAWPFGVPDVARFLGEQLARFAPAS